MTRACMCRRDSAIGLDCRILATIAALVKSEGQIAMALTSAYTGKRVESALIIPVPQPPERAGETRFNLPRGHGGQQIALLHELDMVVVVTADLLVGEHGSDPWTRERENLNLVGDFISTLPAE